MALIDITKELPDTVASTFGSAIIKELNSKASLHTPLQILSVTVF